MAGRVHTMIVRLIDLRTAGYPHRAAAEKIKLIMKGVDPDHYGPDTPDSPDDELVLRRLCAIAREMSIEL